MKKTILKTLASAAGCAFFAGAISAATVTEVEANGASANNTTATAQTVPGSAFTSPSPATVFNPANYQTAMLQGLGGGSDVDFFRFSTPGGTIMLDMDNTPASFDPIVALFDAQGTLLAYDDDSALDPGTVNTIDSFAGVFRLPSAGDYYIAVSENPNFPRAALIGPETRLVRPDGLEGGYAVNGAQAGLSSFDSNGPQTSGLPYTLQVSINPVPEPGYLGLVVGGLAGVAAFRARRRQ